MGMFDWIENESGEPSNKKYWIWQLRDKYSFGVDFSIKKVVFPIIAWLLFIWMFIVNMVISEWVNKKNVELKTEYESLLKEVPKKEMEKFIAFKKEVDTYEKDKVWISYFEIFQFLSRIIPSNNREPKIVLDGKVMDFSYTSESIESQLAFDNTLSQLKDRGLILDFKSTKYQDKTVSQNSGVATFYRSVVPLTIWGNGSDLATNNIRKFLIDEPKLEKKSWVYRFNQDKMLWEKVDNVDVNVGWLAIPEIKNFVRFER